jgi:hypothetical protein
MIDVGRAFLVDGVWAARENDSLRRKGKVGDLGGAWQHLTVDIELSESARDEMRVLRAKVENQDGIERLVGRNGVGVVGRHFEVSELRSLLELKKMREKEREKRKKKTGYMGGLSHQKVFGGVLQKLLFHYR